MFKDKGKHYMESNLVVYHRLKGTDEVVFPNQVFITSGNGDKVNPEYKKIG